MENTSTSIESLNTNVKELTATVKRINSFKFIVMRGIVNGVGTFIGATVVAAIVLTFLVQTLGILGIDLDINSLLPNKN